MNLHLKQYFSEKALEIYKNGDDLLVIAKEIESLMTANNVTFNTSHIISFSSEDGIWANKSFENFIDALDADEIMNAQHMKVILEDHCNFLHAIWKISINKAA